MRISLPLPPGNPARAREVVRSTLSAVPTELVEVAELLTSEIVTNALVHGPGEATLVLDLAQQHVVHIEVIDPDPTLDLRPLQIEVNSPHGRGLAIVDALASAWGAEPRAEGKAVWFELHL